MSAQIATQTGHWRSLADTQACAQALARQPLLANCTIELQGNLGAGKTTWVRQLLQSLGVQGRIKSPTYALVEPYDIDTATHGPFQAWHFDFYRLSSRAEWESAGFRDLFASPGLKLVEWPSHVHTDGENSGVASAFIADIAIEIVAIEGHECERNVNFFAHTARGHALLAGLAP